MLHFQKAGVSKREHSKVAETISAAASSCRFSSCSIVGMQVHICSLSGSSFL